VTPPPITLACLDMAGTTVTDDGAVDEAFSAALVAGGIQPSTPSGKVATSYIRDTMGQSKIDVFTTLFRGDLASVGVANRSFEESYARSIAANKIGPVPGAIEAIERLRHSGVRVCLTTGFSPTTRDSVIDALRWRDRIDLALSPSDCGRGRPFPDMILHALIALEIDEVAAVAVAGDTASDLVSGRRAGAAIVAGVLTGAHDRAELEAVPPTHILASVAELPDVILGGRVGRLDEGIRR
jgi:phosphoglycolate phosphatase